METSRAQTVLRVLAFAAIVTAWGFNYPFVRIGLEVAPPLWLATLRAATGTAGTALLFLGLPQGEPLDRAGKLHALLLGIPNTALFFGLWFSAGASVPPGEASILIYTFPLWVTILSGPVLARPPTSMEWVSVALGFLGVALVTQPWAASGTATGVGPLVELLLAAVCWGVATVLFKRRFSPGQMPQANGYQLLGGSVALALAAFVVEPDAIPVPSPLLIGVVLYMGLVGTALAYTLWFGLLARYHASTLSTYTFLVPVVALAASAVLFREGLDLAQATGVGLVCVGIYLTGRHAAQGVSEPS